MNRVSPNLNSSRNLQGDMPPELGGLRFGPLLAGGLYLLLAFSAVLALGVQQFPGVVSPAVQRIVPWVFFAFAALFAAYRLELVRRGKYSAFKAFFQIGVALLFFMVLLPQPRRQSSERGGSLEVLLEDDNPHVRALAAEVAGYRQNGVTDARLLVRRLRDADAEVRAKAHASLVRLTGHDLGSPEDAVAVRAWEERFP